MALFSPETWPFPLGLLPNSAYLVGGSVRDRLLNHNSTYLDLDFVLAHNAVETAAHIATACNAGFVVLDKARQIARVVFDDTTVDFAQQQGESIEADLHRRDFTINAIAYRPSTGQLIDPLGGQIDLQNQTIRMVSYRNLAADPLRLLRGYRQAAQLNFTLSADTQTAICQLAATLSTVSRERMHSELDALLSTPASSEYLTPLLEAQLLQCCLPHFDGDRIQQVKAIEQAIAQFQLEMPDYAQRLQSWIKPVPVGHYRSWLKAAKLSCLVCANPKQAEAEMLALKYSRSETQAVVTLLSVQPDIDTLKQDKSSRAQQFFLFKKAGIAFPAVSLIALAQGVSLSTLKPLIERFLNPNDELAHDSTLLTGAALIKQFQLRPGPQIGQILEALELAQAEGRIRDRESAIAFVKAWRHDQQHTAEST